jgi:hypothetical protein
MILGWSRKKNAMTIPEKQIKKGLGGMFQVAECLLSNHKSLSQTSLLLVLNIHYF